MKVILLLAGKGTRFLPLSQSVPKPLIPVGGAPVLAHILATLDPLKVDDLVLVTGYLSDQIEAYVDQIYDGSVSIVHQDVLDGTGGAVNAAREHIDGPVLIIFGDTIFDADLTMLNADDVGNMIWTREVTDFQRFGIVQTDLSGAMARIVEKPREDVGRQANIGLYYISDHKALLSGLDHVMAGGSIGGEFFFTYALNHMVEQGQRIVVQNVEGWHDCGTLEAILGTNAYLLNARGSDHATRFDEDVEIVHPVRIHKDVQLKNCRIGPNVTVGAGSCLTSATVEHSMIDSNCALTDVKIAGSLIGSDQVLTDLELRGCIAANGEITKAS